ncbi:unnamed protein product [Hymenolepis diminuta]|uniref:Uncharacterized protein n=1 Tax=Hymenolepis diminuta TaxID=6216 RepID=A0A564Y791_HYMDI|nr:unnamed protein product [Hymenolepis diminuta]
MAGLPHATRITMLLREFNRSDNCLCLTIDEDENVHNNIGIVNQVSGLILSKKINSDVSFSFLVFDLLPMLRFDRKSCGHSSCLDLLITSY